MASKSSASGCFIFLTIIIGLVFWQVSLILIVIGIIVAFLGSLQSQGYSEYANKWGKIHIGNPCSYSGQYGLIENISVDGNKIIISIKPIRSLLPESALPLDTFSCKFVEGSFPKTIRKLLKTHIIVILQGVSVELSAVEAAIKCQEQFAWCVESMNSLVKMADQINRALSLAAGNPLLEPSIPAMENALARITDESFNITQAKEFSLETLKDLIDYLSVPEEFRQPSTMTELDNLILGRHDDLRDSFNELLEFNNEYIKLLH